MTAFQFKISLNGSKPPVWRKVLVPSTTNFADFHLIIQAVMGWENSHLFAFRYPNDPDNQIGIPYDDDFMDMEVRNAKKIKLKDEFKHEKQELIYDYDFGDSWEHVITLEKIQDQTIMHPVCLAGKNACPPEDCGGIWGYYDLVEIVNNPEHDEYEDMRDWLGLEEGENWDPTYFDLEATNQALKYYLS